jgi:hypothetical protein
MLKQVTLDKDQKFRYVIDFKDVLILRLLGGERFILIPYDEKVEKFGDLKKKVDEPAMELVKKKAESYNNVTKDADL